MTVATRLLAAPAASDFISARILPSPPLSPCRHPTSRGCRIPTPMRQKGRHHNQIELLQGTLDLLILQTLQWGPSHGYDISVAIRTHSNERLQVDTGSLYPALHRLERQGRVAAEWKLSANNQRTR